MDFKARNGVVYVYFNLYFTVFDKKLDNDLLAVCSLGSSCYFFFDLVTYICDRYSRIIY